MLGFPECRRVMPSSILPRRIVKQGVQHFMVHHKRQSGYRHARGVQNGTDGDRVVDGVVMAKPRPATVRPPTDFLNLDPVRKIVLVQIAKNSGEGMVPPFRASDHLATTPEPACIDQFANTLGFSVLFVDPDSFLGGSAPGYLAREQEDDRFQNGAGSRPAVVAQPVSQPDVRVIFRTDFGVPELFKPCVQQGRTDPLQLRVGAGNSRSLRRLPFRTPCFCNASPPRSIGLSQ
jgi:hypothetical protein